MRRFGIALVALVVVACGGGSAPPDAATGPTAEATRPNNNALALSNSTWHITSIDGQPVAADPPTKVYMGLANAFHGIQVSGLCKTLFGTYKLIGTGLTPTMEVDEAPECTGDAAAYRQSIFEAFNGITSWSIAGGTLTLTGAKTIVLERG
jgi:heat shock protein HslJ